MKITTLILFTVLLFISGCGNRPYHTVIESDDMTVYSCKQIDLEVGKYEYWVKDKTSYGWTFRTNKKFNIGDNLLVSKK